MEKNTNERDERLQVYEIGFHIAPIVSAESLPAEVDAIRSLINKQGGEIISEEAPKMIQLAYTISKKVGAVYRKYDTAYFGWVKCEIGADQIAGINQALDQNEHILRYLTIKTVRENTVMSQKISQAQSTAAEIAPTKDGEKGAILSTEEIDKTIEQMVTE